VIGRSGVLAALWIGLVAGGIEAVVFAYRRFGLGRLVFVGTDFYWLLPLVTAILLAAVTVLLTGPVPRRLTRLEPRLRYGIPIGLGSLGLLFLLPGLARGAAMLLALGIAVQGGAWLARRSESFERLVRRTLPVLLLLPLAGGAALHGSRLVLDFRLRAPAVSTLSPNILLIVLDTVRAMELGLYGRQPTTSPNLDGFARLGVVFDQAFSAAPWTAPSHASLFTGRRVHELSIDWQAPLDSTYPTLAEMLRSTGYTTVGMVANTRYTSAETGLARGFDWYEDYRLTLGQALRLASLSRSAAEEWRRQRPLSDPDAPGRVSGEDLTRRFVRWVDRHPRRPFFAFLNYYDAHEPYFPPEPFWSRFVPDRPRQPLGILPAQWSPLHVALRRQAYGGAIAYLDEQLGALFDALLKRQILENTLVIITADHGEEFFEHGLMGHGNSLYAPSVGVPLILVWLGRLPAETRVREPVSNASVAPTVMDLLGRPGLFPGPSLAGYWNGQPVAPSAVTSAVSFARNLPANYPVSRGSLASARLGRYRYIRSARDSVGELYDVEADPLELSNLAAERWARPLVRQLADTVKVVVPRP
jgi:arylsulfatase A-like enzyme